MAKKGIELPVNVLVIIVIAVMVLIALAALVAMGVISALPIQIAAAKGGACAQFSCGAVAASNVDVNINLGNSPEGTPFPRTLAGMCMYDKRCTAGTDTEVKAYCGGCIG